MAAKEISVKKYVVRLSGEERERLETLIRKGKSPARRVLKARILLKADVSEAGKGWSDNRIIDALEIRIDLISATSSMRKLASQRSNRNNGRGRNSGGEEATFRR